ncbi:hypothetical protein [Burkholderia ubonensis]|uniref:hypothetical protein n=1 Tax=Burkholderia ubonensis TaxID=101571 RepID=UPI0009B3E708|nr:hypothetical protein [Burkholderia ubonensis]
MDLSNLIIDIIGGVIGGNVAGKLLEKYSLGPLGNSIAGILGGGIGGEVFRAFTEGMVSPGGEPIDIASILGTAGSGGVGGAVLTIIVGLAKISSLGRGKAFPWKR